MRSIRWCGAACAVLLATAAALAGCSPSSRQENASDAGSSPTTASGGTLRVLIGTDATVLGYPPDIRSISDLIVSTTTLEMLGRYNEKGELEPFLAESWRVDPQNRQIEIRLKSGIKFHDGTDFDAEAVRWNLEQIRLSKKPIFNEKDTESIEAVDKSTVRIRLKTWDIGLMDVIATVEMVSPTAVQQHGKEWAADHPIGTGPFVLESWQKGVSARFKKNENYWQKGKPYLDAVEWRVVQDPATAQAALQAGEADVYYNTSAKVARDFASDPGFEVVRFEAANGAAGAALYIAGNDPKSPWANVDVRRALGYAIDRKAIVDSLLFGYGIPTNQYAVPGSWAYNDDVKIGYDPQKAKELLATAGFGGGFATTLNTSNNPNDVQLATAIQSYLAKVGIDAKLNVVDAAKHREMTGAQGSWDGLILYALRIDSDPSWNMVRNFSSWGTNTRSTARVPEFDELLKASRSVPDFAAKRDVTLRLQKKAFDEYALATPLYVGIATTVKRKNVADDGFHRTFMVYWTPENARMTR